MADKVTQTKILGVGLEYYHEDTESGKDGMKTVYLKIPTARTGLTKEQIDTAILGLIGGNTPILKTTYGDPFDTSTAISTAYTESVSKTEIDIGIE